MGLEHQTSFGGHSLRRDLLSAVKEHSKTDRPTAEDMAEYLLGDGAGLDPSESFRLYRYRHIDTPNPAQRFNHLWFYPLWVTSMPIQWMLRGKIGVDRTSVIGKSINYLLGTFND